jgi:hypothetical protein
VKKRYFYIRQPGARKTGLVLQEKDKRLLVAGFWSRVAGGSAMESRTRLWPLSENRPSQGKDEQLSDE